MSTPVLSAERLAQRRGKKAQSSLDEFVNYGFILGSIAEFERLWSLGEHMLTDHRRLMTPQLFEALMFLKMNHRFLDARIVSEAIGGAGFERVNARMDAYEHFAELESETLRKLLETEQER